MSTSKSKKGWKKKVPTNAQLNRKINKIAKETKPEAKYLDTTASSTNFGTSGLFINLNYPAIGTGDVNRIGDSILLKSITIRGYVYMSAAATASVYRIILLNDKENKVTTVGGVLDTALVGTSNLVNASKTHDNRFQTKFLMDKFGVLDTDGQYVKRFHAYIKLNKRVQFNNTSGTAIVNNYLRFLVCSNESTNVPNITFTARLHFADP